MYNNILDVKGLKVGMNINGRIEQFKSVATTVDKLRIEMD